MNRTLTRSVEILNYIADNKNGVTLKDITNHMQIPKSSAFDIIHTFLNLKYIEQDKYNDKKYVLGISTFMLGNKYSANKNLVDITAKYLNPLADELSRTGFLALLDGFDIVYVHKHMGTGVKLMSCKIGTRHPSYTTSVGKALLAFSDREKILEVLNEVSLIAKTDNTILSKNLLVEELSEIHNRGYSIDNKENEEHRVCYGAPIFDSQGKVIAAISISDMVHPEFTDKQLGEKVKECALKISREIGYFT